MAYVGLTHVCDPADDGCDFDCQVTHAVEELATAGMDLESRRLERAHADNDPGLFDMWVAAKGHLEVADLI